MADGMEDQHRDDATLRRLLTERLPRHPSPPHLRAAIIQAASRETRRPAWTILWMPSAAAAVAMALIMLLWIAPSLPTTAPGDPVRLLAHAVISEHARTILWGESREDVVPAVLPRAMEESGVALNWVFAGDDAIQLVNAQPTYLEGRRGIELTYRDSDGHFVTYVVLPAGTLVLPERGRVQIDRWRPLVRTDGGFSSIIWKQQNLLCLLVSDLVSDTDLAKLKQYFVKVRSSTEPYQVY
jgi:anti-sigma factor RsiW